MAWGPLSGSASLVIVSSAAEYLGAYINRSSAGNDTIDLKFNGAVAGADRTTGVTIGVRAGSSGSYSTLDLASTTPSIANTDYIRYTLTGTVDTFQAGHEVQVSISSSATFTIGGSAAPEVTNDTTLTNSSTVDWIALTDVFYKLGNVSDAVGSLDLTNVNSVTFSTGKIGQAAVFSGSNYLEHADNAAFNPGDSDFVVWAWVNADSISNMGVLGRWDGGADKREYTINLKSTGEPRFFLASDGTTATDSWAQWGSALSAGSWYLVGGWYDATNNLIYLNVNNGTAVTASHSGGAYTASQDFVIGEAGGASNNWDGKIDALGIGIGSFPTSDEWEDLYNDGDGKEYPYLPDTI